MSPLKDLAAEIQEMILQNCNPADLWRIIRTSKSTLQEIAFLLLLKHVEDCDDIVMQSKLLSCILLHEEFFVKSLLTTYLDNTVLSEEKDTDVFNRMVELAILLKTHKKEDDIYPTLLTHFILRLPLLARTHYELALTLLKVVFDDRNRIQINVKHSSNAPKDFDFLIAKVLYRDISLSEDNSQRIDESIIKYNDALSHVKPDFFEKSEGNSDYWIALISMILYPKLNFQSGENANSISQLMIGLKQILSSLAPVQRVNTLIKLIGDRIKGISGLDRYGETYSPKNYRELITAFDINENDLFRLLEFCYTGLGNEDIRSWIKVIREALSPDEAKNCIHCKMSQVSFEQVMILQADINISDQYLDQLDHYHSIILIEPNRLRQLRMVLDIFGTLQSLFTHFPEHLDPNKYIEWINDFIALCPRDDNECYRYIGNERVVIQALRALHKARQYVQFNHLLRLLAHIETIGMVKMGRAGERNLAYYYQMVDGVNFRLMLEVLDTAMEKAINEDQMLVVLNEFQDRVSDALDHTSTSLSEKIQKIIISIFSKVPVNTLLSLITADNSLDVVRSPLSGIHLFYVIPLFENIYKSLPQSEYLTFLKEFIDFCYDEYTHVLDASTERKLIKMLKKARGELDTIISEKQLDADDEGWFNALIFLQQWHRVSDLKSLATRFIEMDFYHKYWCSAEGQFRVLAKILPVIDDDHLINEALHRAKSQDQDTDFLIEIDRINDGNLLLRFYDRLLLTTKKNPEKLFCQVLPHISDQESNEFLSMLLDFAGVIDNQSLQTVLVNLGMVVVQQYSKTATSKSNSYINHTVHLFSLFVNRGIKRPREDDYQEPFKVKFSKCE